MGTDDLLFLLASDWFVLHAEAIGLLPGLDQDDIETVSVAARTPIQRLMAAADSYRDVSPSPARIAASAAEFLAGCEPERVRAAASALLARFAAQDAVPVTRGAPVLAAHLEAIVAAGTAGFTSWDESLDLFRRADADGSALIDAFATRIAPHCAPRAAGGETA